jgi:hypothetical protein
MVFDNKKRKHGVSGLFSRPVSVSVIKNLQKIEQKKLLFGKKIALEKKMLYELPNITKFISVHRVVVYYELITSTP